MQSPIVLIVFLSLFSYSFAGIFAREGHNLLAPVWTSRTRYFLAVQ